MRKGFGKLFDDRGYVAGELLLLPVFDNAEEVDGEFFLGSEGSDGAGGSSFVIASQRLEIMCTQTAVAAHQSRAPAASTATTAARLHISTSAFILVPPHPVTPFPKTRPPHSKPLSSPQPPPP